MISAKENIPLSRYCTFSIGGAAKQLIEVYSIDEMQNAIIACHRQKIRYLILGKGSNCLFDDKGFNGQVIVNRISFLNTPEEGVFHVGAGYSFSLLGAQTARRGWSGLEFASGIPGSVGGAVYMNAGANGNETCTHLTSVDYVDEKGEIFHYTKGQLLFSYRSSTFQKMIGAITGATFTLDPFENARKKQLDIIKYRQQTQPYSDKSAGCIFRNPDCGHAGALIERCGLKGHRIGGAEVSAIHANFIINADQATSKDVLDLVEFVKKRVKDETGILLNPEICYIPY